MNLPSYEAPKVLHHQPLQFETAQSWNRGRGEVHHPGTGNNGENHPHDPRDKDHDKHN